MASKINSTRRIVSQVCALLIVTLLASACSSQGAKGANSTTGSKGNWFCQTGADGENWDCVQDEALARAPRPDRLPQPRVPEPVAQAQPEDALATAAGIEPQTETNQSAASTLMSGEEAAGGAAATAPAPNEITDGATGDAERALPVYMQLAYQPAEPTQLADLPGDLYTVQLLAMSSEELLAQYIRDNNLAGVTTARIETQGELYYVLLLGLYETRELAERARDALPDVLQEVTPLIRPLHSLQAAMRRGDQLAADNL